MGAVVSGENSGTSGEWREEWEQWLWKGTVGITWRAAKSGSSCARISLTSTTRLMPNSVSSPRSKALTTAPPLPASATTSAAAPPLCRATTALTMSTHQRISCGAGSCQLSPTRATARPPHGRSQQSICRHRFSASPIFSVLMKETSSITSTPTSSISIALSALNCARALVSASVDRCCFGLLP